MNEKLLKYLKDRDFDVLDTMSTYIELWKSWYVGAVEGFSTYSVWNGLKKLTIKRASLQLAKGVCEQLANLLFNEKCKIAIDSKATEEFVNQVFDSNNMFIKLNESQERKAALGTVCYIPYYTAQGIKINYVTAENMVPLSWENGVINELCVFSKITSSGKEYLYVQLFYLKKTGGNYTIENLLFDLDKVYEPINFLEIKGFENVKPIVETNSATKPFIIDRLNVANNLDMESPFGIAVFANAIDTMRFCDTIYDSYINEFVLGRKRIMVATEATNFANDGNPVFDPNDMVYYQLPEGVKADGDPFIKEIDMELRSSQHQQAIQQALNIFSSQCGLGENFFRYNSGSMATATQVVSENNTMFRTLKKHEIILEAALVDLVHLIVEIGIRYNLASGLDLEAETTVTFDDSIIEDKNAEITRKMTEVSQGLIRPEIYLSWRYGVTEREALEMMPGTGEDGSLPIEEEVI